MSVPNRYLRLHTESEHNLGYNLRISSDNCENGINTELNIIEQLTKVSNINDNNIVSILPNRKR